MACTLLSRVLGFARVALIGASEEPASIGALVLRNLIRGVEVLILDEPTSALSNSEAERLFGVILIASLSGERLRALLAAGADVDAADGSGATPLQLAAAAQPQLVLAQVGVGSLAAAVVRHYRGDLAAGQPGARVVGVELDDVSAHLASWSEKRTRFDVRLCHGSGPRDKKRTTEAEAGAAALR